MRRTQCACALDAADDDAHGDDAVGEDDALRHADWCLLETGGDCR